jgi:hypothetical protein
MACCKVPVAPDRAANQERSALHLDAISTGTGIVTAITISPLRNTDIIRWYSPPNHSSLLALLCSRQI